MSKTADTRGDSERGEDRVAGRTLCGGPGAGARIGKGQDAAQGLRSGTQDLLAKSTAALKAASEQMVAGCQANVAVVAPTSGNSAPRKSVPSIWRPIETSDQTRMPCMRAVTCRPAEERKRRCCRPRNARVPVPCPTTTGRHGIRVDACRHLQSGREKLYDLGSDTNETMFVWQRTLQIKDRQ